MPKITFIGAGSTVFAKRLLTDILLFPELSNSTISLHDIDEERLQTSVSVAKNLANSLEINPVIESSTDRREALDGADYAINMIQVGGYKPCTVTDFDIPKKYGLQQTIGDTLGIGGIMRGLRTIPVMLEMCEDMEDVCPDVTFLNYANPMAMITWALNEMTSINSLGLCHSVRNTARELSEDIGVPLDEISYLCAGINHMAFYFKFERKTENGIEDLYPLIQKVIDEDRVPDWNRVRYRMFQCLGYFVTESSEHFSEYVPWFIKRDRPDNLEKFNVPIDEYLKRCEIQNAMWEVTREQLEHPNVSPEEAEKAIMAKAQEAMKDSVMAQAHSGLLKEVFSLKQSGEYAPEIIHSMETDIPRVAYGNVQNHGLIDNLPKECAVEVPCLVDRNGIQPVQIGPIPTHLAALMQTNINVQALTVEAALTRNRQHIYHAAMLDPHTAAELDLDQIWNLVDDLIEAHGDWLPEYW
ncbi:alpha-glucosidase/alpha-galactosidase [candidate division KSB3 bacterium]|uniref:Alpha-glucosidase/alpha-galactosidase n=1 Tax=candidate division KSB3 bacterium TaxID=2044937 RepID=A0A2G6KEG2_9BACT|nr:MAG: alpha-glucosidase/alpha-galactosidase [candidate division KSB3 bacterium]